jgi:hypothetical protein
MLRDATLRSFLELVEAAGVLRKFNKAENRAELGGDRTVLFRSADSPDRLRGPNLGWFWLDEAAMMVPEVWLIMLGRLREEPARAWCTTTPRGKNWLHRTFTRGWAGLPRHPGLDPDQSLSSRPSSCGRSRTPTTPRSRAGRWRGSSSTMLTANFSLTRGSTVYLSWSVPIEEGDLGGLLVTLARGVDEIVRSYSSETSLVSLLDVTRPGWDRLRPPCSSPDGSSSTT